MQPDIWSARNQWWCSSYLRSELLYRDFIRWGWRHSEEDKNMCTKTDTFRRQFWSTTTSNCYVSSKESHEEAMTIQATYEFWRINRWSTRISHPKPNARWTGLWQCMHSGEGYVNKTVLIWRKGWILTKPLYKLLSARLSLKWRKWMALIFHPEHCMKFLFVSKWD